MSSGYKKIVAEKGLTDETYTADGVALIRISGTPVHNNKALQVDTVCVFPNKSVMMYLYAILDSISLRRCDVPIYMEVVEFRWVVAWNIPKPLFG